MDIPKSEYTEKILLATSKTKPEEENDFSDDEMIDNLINVLCENNEQEIIETLHQNIYGSLKKQRKRGFIYEMYPNIFDEAFSKCANSLYLPQHSLSKNEFLKIIYSSLLHTMIDVFLKNQNRDYWMNDQDIEKIKNKAAEEYPLATKKMKHRYKTNTQKRNFLEEIKKSIKEEWELFIINDFSEMFIGDEEVPINEDKLNHNSQAILDFIFGNFQITLERLIKEHIDRKYFDIEKRFKAEEKTKEKRLKTEEMPAPAQKIREDSGLFRNIEKQQHIDSTINNFNLQNAQKTELKRLLYRLGENKKNLKKADFFGENPHRFPIGVKDEGAFLDLVEDLGIPIEDFNKPEEKQNNQEINEENQHSNLLENKEEVKNETNTEDISTENIVDQIQKWYSFENIEEFKKDLDVFRNKNGSQSVLRKMLNPDLMQQTIAKGKGIFTIEIGGSERIVLEIENGQLKIKKFFDDHTAYDVYLSSLKY